jgi:hypothetical protein
VKLPVAKEAIYGYIYGEWRACPQPLVVETLKVPEVLLIQNQW